MLGNYRVATELVATKVVLSSIELVSQLVSNVLYIWRPTQSPVHWVLDLLFLGQLYACYIHYFTFSEMELKICQ
jgi:hypothetical protein